MNIARKVILGASTIGVVGIVYAHNPWSGYDDHATSQENFGPRVWHPERPGCKQGSADDIPTAEAAVWTALSASQRSPSSESLQKATMAALERRGKLLDCVSVEQLAPNVTVPPITEWNTRSPLFWSFGSVQNVFWALACLLLSATALFAIASNDTKGQART